MRTYDTSPGAGSRIETAFVGASSGMSESRSASIHVLKSPTRAGQYQGSARSAQTLPALRNEMAELVADIDGLPVLVRLFVNDLSARSIGNDADIHSLLSST